MTDEEVLDEQVTDIIANQHIAPPPAHAFLLDHTATNDGEECMGGLKNSGDAESIMDELKIWRERNESSPYESWDNDRKREFDQFIEKYVATISPEAAGSNNEGYLSNKVEDEEAEKSIDLDDEEECRSDFSDEEYQSSALEIDGATDDEQDEFIDEEYQSSARGDEDITKCNGVNEYSVDDLNDEEYQPSEVDLEETVDNRNYMYGRWKMGIFIAVFGLILIVVTVGVGASKRKGGVGESASAIVDVPRDGSDSINDAATPLSLCISRQSFEILWLNEIEEFNCNLDDYCDSTADIGACHGNTGTICEGACNSPEACVDNQGDIQSCSCLGTDACDANIGDVGIFACNGKHACKKNSGAIGKLSCNGNNRSCFDNNGKVESESCNGLKSCLENDGDVSSNSCNELKSCNQNTGPVGENSCNGQESCLKNTGVIGANSCNGEKSCCGNTEVIVSGECNEDFECCNEDESQCECPSKTNSTSVMDSQSSLISEEMPNETSNSTELDG